MVQLIFRREQTPVVIVRFLQRLTFFLSSVVRCSVARSLVAVMWKGQGVLERGWRHSPVQRLFLILWWMQIGALRGVTVFGIRLRAERLCSWVILILGRLKSLAKIRFALSTILPLSSSRITEKLAEMDLMSRMCAILKSLIIRLNAFSIQLVFSRNLIQSMSITWFSKIFVLP